MAAGCQRHLCACEIDEHQIGGARQQVAGPVRRIGPHPGAGAAVPADAAADGAGIAQNMTVADSGARVAGRGHRNCGKTAADGTRRHDVCRTTDGNIAGQLADHECATQRGRAADDQRVGAGIAAFDLQRSGCVLHVAAGDVERTDRAGAARA